jgi:hypothetical protein
VEDLGRAPLAMEITIKKNEHLIMSLREGAGEAGDVEAISSFLNKKEFASELMEIFHFPHGGIESNP